MTNTELDIIKSPEAAKMLQMVTRGFYDNDYIGLWLFEVMGREYDGMADWARELRLEAFPQTATWSISIWEFVYGIEPDETQPLEYRRQQILSKKLQRPPINPAHIEAVLSALTGCPVTVTENVAPYTFKVQFDESGSTEVDWKIVMRALNKIKPSHLALQVQSDIVVTFDVNDYDAGAVAEYIKEFFYEDTEIITITAAEYTGGAASEYIREEFIE